MLLLCCVQAQQCFEHLASKPPRGAASLSSLVLVIVSRLWVQSPICGWHASPVSGGRAVMCFSVQTANCCLAISLYSLKGKRNTIAEYNLQVESIPLQEPEHLTVRMEML